jgi:hypothetical protein
MNHMVLYYIIFYFIYLFIIKGLYPGRAFAIFSEYSRWIFMNTNTIPFYKFFPKLEGQFPSLAFNFVQGDENPQSKLYIIYNRSLDI